MSKLTITVFTTIILLISCFQLKAQLHDGCTDPACNEPWTQAQDPIKIALNEPECSVEVHYEYRICNGVYQYRYLSMTTSGNCTQMANFSIYHYDVSSIMEMVDIIMAEEKFQMEQHPPVSDCPNSSSKVKIYSAACGVWVKCSYIIDTQAEVKQDRGYNGDCPTPDEDGYIDKWKWQSCGNTCCKRVYDICWYNSPITDEQEIKVTQHPATQIGQCDQQGNFGPWEHKNDPQHPDYSYECEHSCNL